MKLEKIIENIYDYSEALRDIEVDEYIGRREVSDIQKKLENIALKLDDITYHLDNIRYDIVNHM